MFFSPRHSSFCPCLTWTPESGPPKCFSANSDITNPVLPVDNKSLYDIDTYQTAPLPVDSFMDQGFLNPNPPREGVRLAP